MNTLIATLFFILSCSPVCWRCCAMDPSCIAVEVANFASYDWMWTSLCELMCPHLLCCLLPVVEWLSDPCSSCSLKRHSPWKFSSYSTQGKVSSHFLLYFHLLMSGHDLLRRLSGTVEPIHCFLTLGSEYSVSVLSDSSASYISWLACGRAC